MAKSSSQSEAIDKLIQKLNLIKTQIYNLIDDSNAISALNRTWRNLPTKISEALNVKNNEITKLNERISSLTSQNATLTSEKETLNRQNQDLNRQLLESKSKEFNSSLLDVDADGQLKYNGSLIPSKYVTFDGVRTPKFSMNSSSYYSWPKEFDKNLLSIDSSDGQLKYNGSWVSSCFVQFDSSSSTKFKIGTSSSVSVVPDLSLINSIDSDGELRYNGNRTHRYVNVNGSSQSLSISSSPSVEWGSSGGGNLDIYDSGNDWRVRLPEGNKHIRFYSNGRIEWDTPYGGQAGNS